VRRGERERGNTRDATSTNSSPNPAIKGGHDKTGHSVHLEGEGKKRKEKSGEGGNGTMDSSHCKNKLKCFVASKTNARGRSFQVNPGEIRRENKRKKSCPLGNNNRNCEHGGTVNPAITDRLVWTRQANTGGEGRYEKDY